MTEPLMRTGAPPKRKRRWTTRLMWVPPVVVITLGLGALATGYVVAGGPEPIRDLLGLPEPSVTQAETFTVSGHATLTLGKFAWSADPEFCTGMGAWKELTLGSPVVVTDQNGTTVGTGSIGIGRPVRNPNDTSKAIACQLQFYVNGVPADRKFYRVTISDRKTVEYNRFDIKQPLDITID